MPVPGSLSVMSFYLLHGEKGVVFNICLYLVFPSCPSTSCKVIQVREAFHRTFVPGFPCVMSFY